MRLLLLGVAAVNIANIDGFMTGYTPRALLQGGTPRSATEGSRRIRYVRASFSNRFEVVESWQHQCVLCECRVHYKNVEEGNVRARVIGLVLVRGGFVGTKIFSRFVMFYSWRLQKTQTARGMCLFVCASVPASGVCASNTLPPVIVWVPELELRSSWYH